MKKIATVIIAGFCSSFSATADEQFELRASESVVKSFIGACVQIMPNLDIVEAGARNAGWKELTGDEAKLMAPSDPSAWSRSWLVADAADVPFMIGISRAVTNGKKIAVCSLTNPYAPALKIQSSLIKILALGTPLSVKKDAGRQTSTWTTKANGREIFISLLDTRPMNDPGVTMSAITIEPAR